MVQEQPKYDLGLEKVASSGLFKCKEFKALPPSLLRNQGMMNNQEFLSGFQIFFSKGSPPIRKKLEIYRHRLTPFSRLQFGRLISIFFLKSLRYAAEAASSAAKIAQGSHRDQSIHIESACQLHDANRGCWNFYVPTKHARN